jgi:hypothetical protein
MIYPHGNAITMFIGERKSNGNISREKYTRHFKRKAGIKISQ